MLTLLAAMTLAAMPIDSDQLMMRGYPEVRDALIADGWNAAKSKECAADDWTVKYFCEDFPEVQYCSPTGLLVCHFVMTKNGNELHIYTRGEDEHMLVENVSPVALKGNVTSQ